MWRLKTFGSRTGTCGLVLRYTQLPRALLNPGPPDKWSRWDPVQLVPVLSDECSGFAVDPGRERLGDSSLSLMDDL